MIIASIIVAGCINGVNENKSSATEHTKKLVSLNSLENVVEYAKYFKLYPNWDNGYCVVIDSEGNKFILLEGNNSNIAFNISNAKIIHVPVKRIVTDFYCPIIATADILNSYHNTIVGAPKYAIKDSPKLSELYKEKKVVDIGSPTKGVNYEIIANLSPDIVFLSDWPSEDKVEEKLKELGITVSRYYTYKEPTYLGRIEWVKFAAAFWGSNAYKKAEKWFNNVVKTKENITNKLKDVKYKPTVVIFSWSKYRNMPLVYGNDKYYNELIVEFKGNNIFGDYKTQYLDKEIFYEKAINADVVIMINYYNTNVTNLEEFKKEFPDIPIEKFKAFKNGRFYVSNPKYYIYENIDPAGYMLDFAKMIHPEVFGNGSLKYFYKIQ